jgi:hypothetical protein
VSRSNTRNPAVTGDFEDENEDEDERLITSVNHTQTGQRTRATESYLWSGTISNWPAWSSRWISAVYPLRKLGYLN